MAGLSLSADGLISYTKDLRLREGWVACSAPIAGKCYTWDFNSDLQFRANPGSFALHQKWRRGQPDSDEEAPADKVLSHRRALGFARWPGKA